MIIHQSPVNVFLCYVDEDELLLHKLETHLSLLKRQGQISTWNHRQIVPGMDKAKEIDRHLEQANIILLLVSAEFLASEYCYGIEMQRALQRHEAEQAHVIPIIIRPVDWKSAPFAHLQPLPASTKAITSWSNQDEAWLDVALGIRKVIEEFMNIVDKRDISPLEMQQLVPIQKRPAPPAPFPPVWNVPYRHIPFFTGREQLLEQLFQGFITDAVADTLAVQALTGIGGIGKTQTAVAYAYRYRAEYQSVFWVRAETEGDLVAGFASIARLLALPSIFLERRADMLNSIHEWFRTMASWLLIFDNADDLLLVEPFVPRSARGHVLLTSRNAAMGGLARPFALSPLSPDEGALCILRRANSVPWGGQLHDASPTIVKVARELSQLMGGLPLALEQAGAYIDSYGRSVNDYLKLYQQYRAEVQHNQQGVLALYHTPVTFAWNSAKELVEQANPAALELLYFCAFLAPDAIPYELIHKHARMLGPTLGKVATNPLALDSAIGLLRKHSLIKNEVNRDTDISILSIHRILQEVLRDDMDLQTQQIWAKRAVRVVASALPSLEWQIIQAHASACVLWIDQWKMKFREANLIRQRVVAENM